MILNKEFHLSGDDSLINDSEKYVCKQNDFSYLLKTYLETTIIIVLGFMSVLEKTMIFCGNKNDLVMRCHNLNSKE